MASSFAQSDIFENKDLKNLENLLASRSLRYGEVFQEIEERLVESGEREKLRDLYLFHVSHLIESVQYDSALFFLHKSKKLYKGGRSNELVPVNLTFASVFHYKGIQDSLIYYQELAKEEISQQSPFYGQYLLNEALIQSKNSDHNSAIGLLLDAIVIFEKNEDDRKLAVAYNNLGYNYERIGDWDTHIFYLLKAVSLNKKLGNTYHLIMNYNNLGISYKEKNMLDEAIAVYDSAYVELEKIYSPLQMAQNLMNRAIVYKRKGDLEAAESLYLKSLSICTENNIPYGEMLCKINLGELYRLQGRFEQSREILKSAFDLSFKLKAKKEEALIYEKQAWLARDLGDFRNAYVLLDKYHLLNDSLTNESVRKEANALREKYEVEKKEREILTLSEQKINQQLIIAVMAIFVLVLLVLTQWLFNKNKLADKEKQKQELQRKHLREILENKDKELTAQAAQLIQIKKLLEELKKKNYHDPSIELNLSSFNALQSDFESRITENNQDFFRVLLSRFPDLKPSELKLCAYLRLNLSNKEIADIINKSVRTVESTRFSIRRKMGLEGSDHLVPYLISLENDFQKEASLGIREN